MADLLGSILSSMEKPPSLGDQESRRKARDAEGPVRELSVVKIRCTDGKAPGMRERPPSLSYQALGPRRQTGWEVLSTCSSGCLNQMCFGPRGSGNCDSWWVSVCKRRRSTRSRRSHRRCDRKLLKARPESALLTSPAVSRFLACRGHEINVNRIPQRGWETGPCCSRCTAGSCRAKLGPCLCHGT
ncbi:sperm-associated antigen 7 isoform X3 [Lynx rufus]|uniref:sperm-associated antigen 7 isoform X3 n=1 Tax=Lynx rufus TaxID=61384 RepID=UPI001F126099|nr:sperm-associated antigen 7 isoform X3 [Lynx rufus]